MNIIEFQTYIDRDTIQLPKQYQDQVRGRVRVIILAEAVDDEEDMVEFLMNHPYQPNSPVPLTRDEIYDRQ